MFFVLIILLLAGAIIIITGVLKHNRLYISTGLLFMITVLLACLFLGNNLSGTIRKDSTTIPDYSAGYQGLFYRTATPTWKQVYFDGFHVSIPYSEQWLIGAVGLSLYDVNVPDEDRYLEFGRPVSEGTYIAREYSLSRKDKNTATWGDPGQAALNESICGSSTVMTLGGKKGVQYFTGGAKGCAVGFAFPTGQYVYFLERAGDIGTSTPAINDEMGKIVRSVWGK